MKKLGNGGGISDLTVKEQAVKRRRNDDSVVFPNICEGQFPGMK